MKAFSKKNKDADTEDAKDKPKKAKDPKKAKEAKTPGEKKDNTFQSSLIILVVIAALSAALSSGLNIWSAQQNIIQKTQEVENSFINVFIKGVNVNVTQLQNDVKFAMKEIEDDPLLEELDYDALTQLKQKVSSLLPNSMDVKIFPLGQYDLDKEVYPPVNFAAQKLLLQAEKAEIDFPDFNKHPDGDYLNMAHAIRSKDNDMLIASLLISYPISVLDDHMPAKKLSDTKLSVVQQFGKGKQQTIYSLGNAAGAKAVNSDTNHPKWKVTYSSNSIKNQVQNVINIAGIGLAINLILIIVGIWLTFYLLKNKFNDDMNMIFEFIRSKSSTLHDPDKLFKTSLFLGFYQNIAELNLQSGESKQSPAKIKSKSKKASQQDDILDIEIADGDENLFGGDEGDAEKPKANGKIDGSIFRAYDIRGVVDETLTKEGVKLIGQAIGSESIEQGQETVIIGKDGRLSGPDLIEALAEGILASGANVIDVGTVPTPLLYFACKTLDSTTGVILTGSHNPANHNGLKIVINGTTLHSEGIQKLKTDIESGSLKTGSGSKSEEDIIPAYLDAIVNEVILAQAINIVIDCGNGVTGVIAEELFKQIGCNVTTIHGEVDGNFPNHHPDPSRPENLNDLIEKVKEVNADIGIAFDGDGDRLGVVTNTGKIIWPDRLMMLFAKDILLRSPGADIIFDVKCSQALAEVIRKQGGRPLMWKTGHSLIKAKLQETGAQLAGEMSGHIFFNDRWYGFDDALYSAARLLEILSTDAQSSEEIFAAFPEKVSTPEINIPIAEENKFEIIEGLTSFGDFGDGNKTTIDGVRIDYSYGWGLVRASNTTSVLVTRFEADSEEQLKEIQAVFKEQILKIEGDLELPF